MDSYLLKKIIRIDAKKNPVQKDHYLQSHKGKNENAALKQEFGMPSMALEPTEEESLTSSEHTTYSRIFILARYLSMVLEKGLSASTTIATDSIG